MSILAKSILCLFLSLLFVTALLFLLSFFKFQTVLTTLIVNRLSASGPAIYEPIEGALDLGLELTEIKNTDSVLSWVKQNNPGVQYIVVFDNQGRIQFSTDRQRIGQSVGLPLINDLQSSEEHVVPVTSDQNFVSAFKLLNNYDQMVGGGAIVYAKDEFNRQVAKFKSVLLQRSVLIFIVFTLLASIGIAAAFRSLLKYLTSIETSHKNIRESESMGQNVCFIDTSGLPLAVSESALIRMDGFDNRLCAIERNIATAGEALDTLKAPPLVKGDNVEVADRATTGSHQSELSSRLARPMVFIMIGALFISSVVFAYISYLEFNRFLEPELKKKAQLIALNIDRDLKRALEFGIPFEELVGVDKYLELVANEFEEVKAIEILDATGNPRYRSGRSNGTFPIATQSEAQSGGNDRMAAVLDRASSIIYSVPLLFDDVSLGQIAVGIDRKYIRRQLDSILYDNITIFIISVLVAFQVMTALFMYSVTGPIERLNTLINQMAIGNFSRYIVTRGGDSLNKVSLYLSQAAKQLNERFKIRYEHARSLSDASLKQLDNIGKRFALSSTGRAIPLIRASVGDIRLPLFIFAFAEELQKSFLPIYVRQLYEPVYWLNESVVISLPIVAWLTIVGLAAPFTGRWSRRFGSRNIFLMGLIPSTLGFLGCSMSQTISQFVLCRSATALGYAMITISCQEYLLGKHIAGDRNVNIAAFVAIVISATMCGTAIGGILAARIGYRETFQIAAALMLAAGFTGYRMLSREPGTDINASGKKTRGWQGIMILSRNWRFLLMLICIVIPTNILMAAYLWYLVPLYMFQLGATPAEIARTMMVYYLLIIIIGNAASKKVVTMDGLMLLVGLGGLLSGVGLVAFHQWHNFWAVVFSVSILGLSHALIKAPQITLSLDLCKAEVASMGHNMVLGALRLLERFGSIAGLIAGAAIINAYGYQSTTGIAGAAVCAGSLVFILFFLLHRRKASRTEVHK
jgi:MFS family permease/sensor histidine kinase regulating citrate/malate metabolism